MKTNSPRSSSRLTGVKLCDVSEIVRIVTARAFVSSPASKGMLGAFLQQLQWRSLLVMLLVLIVASSGTAAAQTATVPLTATPSTISPGALPAELLGKAKLLGTRLFTPGLERVIVVGTLQRNGLATPATVTLELPTKAKVDLGTSGVIGFDGSVPWNSLSALSSDDQDLLEALSDDTPETFLYSVASRSHWMRAVARRARMDNGKAPSYGGPWMDVYQEVGVAASRTDKAMRQKHFYFDSSTGLPSRVRYEDPSGHRIEVVRAQWTQVQGQYVPLQIVRYQDGKLTHSFIAVSTTITAAVPDATFVH